MKILLVHNYYKEPGGEDVAFSSTAAIFREHGHEVFEYVVYNSAIDNLSKVKIAINTIWSWNSYHELLSLLRKVRPDVAHFFNTFPLISPSAYYACHQFGIPVIQSLDNPRLMCPSANFYRNEQLCLDCLGRIPPFPGIIHGCYHSSHIQTAVVGFMVAIHHWLGTWEKRIDKYLVATPFYRDLFIRAGFPDRCLEIKPHFILRDPDREQKKDSGDYVLFLGRLDPEKGIRTLLKAWEIVNLPLKIRGGGALENEVKRWIETHPDLKVDLVERLDQSDLERLIKGARFLIWPSDGYYETFGLAAVEGFALSKPVLASDIGVMNQMVTDGKTGMHFRAGNRDSLAEKAITMWEDLEMTIMMGRNARLEYLEKYTANHNYELLCKIYRNVIDQFVQR